MRWVRETTRAHQELLTQFIKYCIAGGTAFLVQLAVLELLVWVGANATLAAGIGFACAVPVNYAIQRRLVFIVAGRHSRHFSRFVAVTLAALGLNTFLFWLISTGLGLPNAASLVIVTGVMLILNFLANRFITFAPTKPAPREVADAR